MNTGNWNIDVNLNGMPQKIATAFEKLKETLAGAEYEFIAYLGTQEVNGINHAVLAKQIVTTGRDSENIVVMIFNEKPNTMEAALVAIERVVEESAEMLGGTTVRVDKILDPEGDEMKIWHDAFVGYVGYSMKPIAYLGSQVTKGPNFIFAATADPAVPNSEMIAAVVTINPMMRTVRIVDMLESKQSSGLKYAFNW